jgi:hypothetical protein
MCSELFVCLCVSFFLLLVIGLVVWPTAGCKDFLTDFITDRLGSANYVFRLFTNNITPASGDVIGSYTEAAFAGYVPVSGAGITWSAPTVSGLVANTNGTNITFNNTSVSTQTVYGVFVTDPSGTILYFAERDPGAPINIPAAGNYIYTPNQQFKSIN